MVHISLIRRVALAVFAFCLASSLAAQSYDPHILKSEVVTLDAKTIESYASRGVPFELALGEKTSVSVVVAPAPVWPDEGVTIVEVQKDGSEKESLFQSNITYAGDVIGDDPAESDVRLTIADGVLEGYVLTSGDWWFIEPLSRFDPKAGADQYLVYAARDVDVAADLGNDTVSTDVLFDYPFIKDGVFPVAMVADLDYLYRSGSVAAVMARHAALINEVNGIYNAQFGRHFKVPRVVIDLGANLTSKDPQTLLNQLKGFITLQKLVELRSYVGHLTTGKEMNGNVYGKAERPGYRGWSQQSLSCAFRNLIVAAHEIGHNFDSVHEEADYWCTVVINGLCVGPRQTLDAAAYKDYSTRRFSDGTRNAAHNNGARVCANLAGRGFPCHP